MSEKKVYKKEEYKFNPYEEIIVDSETFNKILNDNWTEEEREQTRKGIEQLIEDTKDFYFDNECITNFDRIKSYDIDKFAQYIRSECVSSLINGVALSVDEIKEFLNEEFTGE